MRVRELMTENPVCCTPDDTVQEAARMMASADCGCLPVVSDTSSREIVGVVTDRDLACRCLAEGRGADTRVSDVMSTSPSCCSVDSDAREVERIMAERKVRRVPVVDEGNHVVGMIAQADLARDERDFGDHEVRHTIERISEPSRQERAR